MHKPSRKHLRLPGYDYSRNGAYFITICTAGRKPLLSRVVPGDGATVPATIALTNIGQIAERHALRIPGLQNYVIMPNHIHLLLLLDDASNPDRRDISSLIRSFKTLVTKSVGKPLWQTSFHDHIIRDEQDYLNCWNYIDLNPDKWALDRYYEEI